MYFFMSDSHISAPVVSLLSKKDNIHVNSELFLYIIPKYAFLCIVVVLDQAL